MGGIAGLCHLDGFPASERDLKRASRLLAHRGPNGRGVHLDKEVGLAHVRLAVLDLGDRGLQPMSAVGGRYWIVYDGEIFNFLEIKRELKALGYPFKTETDTEVILAAYMAWGSDCLQQFNGMWAFAILDAQERTLFLSRDRFGIKPLYFYWDKNLFAFSSEIKGFLGIESISLQFDSEGLAAAFAYPSLIEGMEITAWKGVKRLLPGHFLEISKNIPRPKTTRWWNTLSHFPEVSSWPIHQKKHFRLRLFEACKESMVSDVPIGFCLSGGIDSTALFALGQEAVKENASERQAPDCCAALMMRLGEEKKSKNLEAFVSDQKGRLFSFKRDPEELVSQVLDLIYQFEEVGPFDLGRWLFFQSARQENIRVCLDGLGSEIICAIPLIFVETRVEDCLSALMKTAHLIERFSNGAKGQEWLLENSPTRIQKIESAEAPFDPFQIPFLRYDDSALTRKASSFSSPIWNEDASSIALMDKAFQLQYFLSHAGYLQTLLRRLDLAAMAHGVEARCPFLDWRVVVYSLALPFSVKIGEKSGDKSGKNSDLGILQEAMRGTFSDKLLKRSPVSYPFPLESWLGDALNPLVQKIIESRSFQEFPYWNGRQVSQLAREKNFKAFWPYFQAFFLYTRFQEMRERVFGEGM